MEKETQEVMRVVRHTDGAISYVLPGHLAQSERKLCPVCGTYLDMHGDEHQFETDGRY